MNDATLRWCADGHTWIDQGDGTGATRGRTHFCQNSSQKEDRRNEDLTRGSAPATLPVRAVEAIPRCEATGTRPIGLRASMWSEAGWMAWPANANRCRHRHRRPTEGARPETANGWLVATWSREGSTTLPQTARSPVERRGLNHPEMSAERGKPIRPPLRESEPQGKPKGVRVWDRGESECRSVAERIRSELDAQVADARFSGTQVRRLPRGLSSRESLAKRLREECR